ncbi:TPA: DUF1186 domain-containing protein [Legionella pneumophila]|nr:DUF1186 domain-containing protein [Legionella pneumophila]HAT2137550.1 DUF1186 domain-containing protein [Legionella pneumophila]HAT2143664.1 DUF1186 domain-containing protein [Legionella pneumophila]HAT2146813.1 DUF1186 domain-containing protein [Legionella pneumophila]HAT2161930.1 DUF1186 domain-containing protein [Legionella pneumophila]
MHIEDILNHFDDPKGRFPKEALNAALEQQAIITPYLLSILKDTISNYKAIDDYQMGYTFSLYILSKFREKEAFPYVLALASLPDEWPEELLGDCITEALARFIVSTFNDDLAAIKKLIENPNLNEWSRNAALKSLLGLVALDKLKRDELIDYLRMLFHSPLADDEDFLTRLVETASDLYPEELMEEINKVFEEDKIDTFCVDKAWINRMLAMGKEECLNQHVYNDHFHLPIDDVEQEMLWMSGFREKPSRQLGFEQDSQRRIWNIGYDERFEHRAQATFIRSTPKIGRNDPCHCGSGVKFKKCCLN